MDFREMDEFIQYLTLKCRLVYNGYQIQEESYYYSLHDLVMNAMKKLNDEERRMIENEYFFNDRSWWYEYYSRSTYYRLKKQSMIKFLDILNQII